MTFRIDIRPIQQQDYPQVQSVYQKGIETGNATFQTTVKDWHDWQKVSYRMQKQRVILVWCVFRVLNFTANKKRPVITDRS